MNEEKFQIGKKIHFPIYAEKIRQTLNDVDDELTSELQ